MAEPTRIPGDMIVRGKITANEVEPTNTKFPRSDLSQEVLVEYPLDLTSAKVHDNLVSLLNQSPGTTDDLGLFGDTFATDTPYLETGDLGGQNGVTQYARFQVVVPAEYDDGEDIQFRIRAEMSSANAADTSATIDIEAFDRDREGSVSGSDLIATSGQDMNSTSWADFTFTVDSANVSPGTLMDVRVSINIDDGSGNTVKGKIGDITLQADIRG